MTFPRALGDVSISHGKPRKESTTIRIDDDILMFFKKFATEEKTGYQTLMNNALREYLKKTEKK